MKSIKNNLILAITVIAATLWAAASRADDQIFVIGDFNGWNIPTADDMNGALPLVYDPEENTHSGTFDFSEGDTKFAFYCHSAKDVYLGRDKRLSPSTVRLVRVLADDGMGDKYETNGLPFDLAEVENIERIDEFTLRDWQGGDISFEITGRTLLRLDADDMPYYTPDSDRINIVYRINGGDWRICEVLTQSLGGYAAGETLYGKEIEFFYTNEFTTDPAPENIWGIEDQNPIIPIDLGGDYYDPMVTDIVSGGHPVKVIFDEWGAVYGKYYLPWSRFSLIFPRCSRPSAAYATVEEDGVRRTAELAMSADFTSELTAHGKEIKISLFQKTGEGSDEEIKEIGEFSQLEYHDFKSHFQTPDYDFNRIFLVTDGDPIELNYDKPTDIRIHIMWSSESADIYVLSPDGIIDIDETDVSDGTPLEFYDLTGNRISSPGKGIYIVKSRDGYRKVML